MKKNWSEIERHYERLRSKTAFDLSAPCVVIDERHQVMETTLSGLANHLRPSAAMSSPSVKRYISLANQVGAEKAMNTLLMGEDGEQFAELWEEAKADLEAGAIATMDDLVAAIKSAKKGFNEMTRRILVVQINAKDADVLLVGPPTEEWSDDFDLR